MLSLLYLLVYLFAGCVIIRALLPAQRPQVRVWLGLSLGLLLMMWLPALLAFAVRFSLLGHMLALIPLAGITVAVWVTRDKTPARALDDKDRQLLILMACVAVPLTLLGGYLQYTHCLREVNGHAARGAEHLWRSAAASGHHHQPARCGVPARI